MFASTTTSTQFSTAAIGSAPARATRRCRAAGVVRVSAAAQTLEGKVVAVSGSKSKTLLVERKVPHPKYIKRVNVSKKFMFHDEDDSCKIGDKVEVVACKPMSKAKKFTLARVVEACVNDCAV